MPAFLTYNLKANIPPQYCIFDKKYSIFGDSLNTQYTFSIINCYDSDWPLKYNFFNYKSENDYREEINNGEKVLRNLMESNNKYNFYEDTLPYGANFILCSITDSYGGVSNIT